MKRSTRSVLHAFAALAYQTVAVAFLVYCLLLLIGACDPSAAGKWTTIAAWAGFSASCEIASDWHAKQADR